MTYSCHDILSLVMQMKLDRLMGILMILLQNEKTTAPELAKRFEVSRRTIMRDVDSLCLAGIPIVATQGGSGGLAIMAGYKIRSNVLTADELQTLITGLKGIDSVSKTSSFERLMAKLAPENAMISLTDSIVIDLSSHYKDSLSEKIAVLKNAIAAHKVVSFEYYYAKGEVRREIEPYFIQFKWNAWYVFGWCRLREDFRRFKLNRLWDLEVTQQSFVPRQVPPEQASGNDAFPDSHNMLVRFARSMRFRLIEDYGLNSYEETDDYLIMSLNYTNKDYTFGWLLGFGDKAEILEPENTRREFSELAHNISRLYEHDI